MTRLGPLGLPISRRTPQVPPAVVLKLDVGVFSVLQRTVGVSSTAGAGVSTGSSTVHKLTPNDKTRG